MGILFAAESIRNCHRIISGDHDSNLCIPSKTNAFAWQQENMATVYKVTRRLTLTNVVLGGENDAPVNQPKSGVLKMNGIYICIANDNKLP